MKVRAVISPRAANCAIIFIIITNYRGRFLSPAGWSFPKFTAARTFEFFPCRLAFMQRNRALLASLHGLPDSVNAAHPNFN